MQADNLRRELISRSVPRAILSLSIVALAIVPASAQETAAGARLYATHCSACHGADREGVGGTFPGLADVGKRLDTRQIKERIRQGGGLMPPFGHLSEKDVEDITAFLEQ